MFRLLLHKYPFHYSIKDHLLCIFITQFVIKLDTLWIQSLLYSSTSNCLFVCGLSLCMAYTSSPLFLAKHYVKSIQNKKSQSSKIWLHIIHKNIYNLLNFFLCNITRSCKNNMTLFGTLQISTSHYSHNNQTVCQFSSLIYHFKWLAFNIHDNAVVTTEIKLNSPETTTTAKNKHVMPESLN